MSYGQKPTAWSRPQGQQQQINPNLFTNQLGLAAQNQAFSAIPGMALNQGLAGLVNQAAFTNTMNMSTMNSMLAHAQRSQQMIPHQQHQQQIQQPPVRQPQQQQPTSPTRTQRTFIGVVTKMMETYGFVDEDVFFQTNVIRGSAPNVGDRVMVEANYNPSMPFKWNAYRIQMINDSSQGQNRQPAQQQHQNGAGGASRWSNNERPGPGRDRDEPRRQMPAAVMRQPPRDLPAKRPISRHRSRSPPPRRVSPPPPRKRESPRREVHAKRDRDERSTTGQQERAESSVRGLSAKREDSPPRRRQRIIPRYHCNVPKQTLPSGEIKYIDLRRRYTNLYIPSDFINCEFDWIKSIKLENPIKFSAHPITFHILHKDVSVPLTDGEQQPPENPPDADYRYIVKILLISHPGLSVLRQKLSGLLPDGSIDESTDNLPITKNIQLLVGHRGKGEYMCIGGAWSPSLDGEDPMNPQTMVNTAVRTARALTGLDLSNCSKWYKMLQLRYFRVERQRVDSVVLMLPDTSTIPGFKVSEESHKAIQQTLRDQLATKLAAIDSEIFCSPNQPKEADKSSSTGEMQPASVAPSTNVDISESLGQKGGEGSPNPVLTGEQETVTAQGQEEQPQGTGASTEAGKNEAATSAEEAMDTSKNEQPEPQSTPIESAPTPIQQVIKKEAKTHWTVLEPKIRAMKVAELREELEFRGLDSKGVKNVLMQRLLDAIEKEKAQDKENGNEQPVEEQQTETAQDGTQQKATIDAGEEDMESSETEPFVIVPVPVQIEQLPPLQIADEGGNEEQTSTTVEQAASVENAPAAEPQTAPVTETEQAPKVPEKQGIMVKIKEEIIELMETDDATEGKEETAEEKTAREKAEKEARELEKAKEKFEKEKKERKTSLERHYGQIPSEPGIFVFPSKTAKSGKFDCKVMSLHSLMDYRLDDSKEASFEVFLFAEALKEALDRSHAFVVYHSISTALDKDAEKKRRNEALTEACKDDDVVILDENTAGTKKSESDNKSGKEEKDKSPTTAISSIDLRTNFKALVHDFDLFTSFVHFDSNICGYITDRDLEDIIHSVGLNFSRGEVQRLIKKLSLKDRVDYRNLTDKLVDKDGNVKYIPTPTYDNLVQSYAEHAKGHSISELQNQEMPSNASAQQNISESGIVFYQGTLVNLKQCLEQQQQIENERQNVMDKNDQLELQLKSTKEQRDHLEKKKRRLEDDVDRYKKKLHDTEKALRKEQSNNAAAEKGMMDCKRYSERIIGIVEATYPPPKPKEVEKSKEKEGGETETGDPNAGDIVLIDETVATAVEKEDAPEKPPPENGQQNSQDSGKDASEVATAGESVEKPASNDGQQNQQAETAMGE